MEAREVLRRLIDVFEGKSLQAYLCPAGVWTIGRGATGPGITKGVKWTEAQVEDRTNSDMDTYLAASRNLCPRIENEVHGAIADFTYNLGATRLKSSTLRKRINAGDYELAAEEVKKWVWAGGRKLRGLVRRREMESLYIRMGCDNAE